MKKDLYYIFLDIDGVLNNTSTFGLKFKEEGCEILSEECLWNYQYLIDKLKEKYEIRTILTSTWRMHAEAMQKIKSYENKYNSLKIFDVCDLNYIHSRDEQIKIMIERHKIKNYLILDDEPRVGFGNHFIHTNGFDGLLFSQVQNVVNKILFLGGIENESN